MKIKEKFRKNSEKIQKRIKQSLCIATALGTLFFPLESDKPSNYYYISETKAINILYRFRQEIINYPTSNYFSRGDNKIDHIILHATDTDSEEKDLEYFVFKNECSIHYLIGKTGQIYNSVPEEFAAYHSGHYFNKRSIGIEIVQGVHGDFFNRKELFTSTQIEKTSMLIKILMEKYNIPKENILGHHEFNRKKGDPGERNMGAILSRLPDNY